MTQDFKDPSVAFWQPFQSGMGECYPIYPWNYYNTKVQYAGGKKTKGKKPVKKPTTKKGGASYANGVNCPGVKDVPLEYPKSFGPLIPTNASSPKDLEYNGSFSMCPDSNWKQQLTGQGVPHQFSDKPSPEFVNNNLGIEFATQAGGKKSKGKQMDSKKSTRRKTKKGGSDSGDMKQGAGVFDSKQGQLDNSSGAANNYTGGKKQRGGKTHYRGASNPGEPSNFDYAEPFHPEWKDVSGGAKKKTTKKPATKKPATKKPAAKKTTRKQKGGDNYMPNLEGSPLDANTSIKTPETHGFQFFPGNAGAFTQLESNDGLVLHNMKTSPKLGSGPFVIGDDFGGSPGNKGVQTNMEANQTGQTGGKKKTTKKPATKKPAAKKTTTKKTTPKKKSLRGGGSDWALSQNSRGPVNYPNQDPAMFRAFTKTGEYIPNNMLKYAATPVLSGYQPDNFGIAAYNEYCGGKKKTTKSKTTKGKTTKGKGKK